MSDASSNPNPWRKISLISLPADRDIKNARRIIAIMMLLNVANREMIVSKWMV